MNNKPIPQHVLDENNITDAFIQMLANKLTNPEHMNIATRMFIQGTLPMSAIENNQAIDIPTIRHQIADAIWNRRQAMAKHVAEYRRLSEYYSTCKMLAVECRNGKSYVFIKDGHIVAFGMESGDHREGGIYAAKNPVQGEFQWTPNEHLARIRRLDKAFYKRIKKAAFAEPQSMWKMDGRTIVNK